MLEIKESFKEEVIKNRRKLHNFAEIGFNLPRTYKLVESELEKLGIESKKVGRSGISATIGRGNPVILLRADMDALTMEEKTGLDFAAKENCHACGHDAHTAMLLGAAKILKNNEDRLKGRVKLMFQPAEEILAGAKDMVENGVLENPKVDAALGIHIDVAKKDSKSNYLYYGLGNVNFSGDAVKITVLGREAHGSTPHLGIDAINIGMKIVENLNTIARDYFSPREEIVILVGKIQGGTAVNTVADKLEMEVSLRAKSESIRQSLLKKVQEVALKTGEVYGAKVIFEHQYGMPNIYNDLEFSQEILGYARDILGEEKVIRTEGFTGSEDFSIISQRLPSLMLSLGVGSIEEGYNYSLHHGRMILNEDALYTGSILYANLAFKWLENRQ